ncbi:hypothetical protein FSCG_01315 [Fusobacterium vincentii 4_1_13]|jgi:hypothetical protein|uniref:Uncharacterized protein n=2 Tax=Fusobacterium vincentii TaxID=155615 RepID=A0ABV3YAN6_FUSVC|nr:hypothetical protein [Fusobacterium vincentii]EEO40602.1 hypothetical protein FSCG_01315 [Fusobacterium vincentii 4_1_13]
MANKTIKIEKFYSDGINENTSKIKNVVKIIKSEEIAELKEKIPTLIKEKEVRKESKEVQLEKNIEKTKTEEKKYQDLDGDKNPDYKNEQDKYIDVIKKRRNVKIKKKKKVKERDDNEREIKF